MVKVLLDTNILIDFALRREPYFEQARKVMILGYLREIELWVGSSQMSDLIYVITEGEKPRFNPQAQNALDKILQFIRVYATDEEDCRALTDSSWEDLEDALVHRSALGIKADLILTRDQEGFAKSAVKACGYEELFAYLKETLGCEYELLDGSF